MAITFGQSFFNDPYLLVFKRSQATNRLIEVARHFQRMARKTASRKASSLAFVITSDASR